MALLRAAATVGGYTMASRVLGFARDLVFAALLGAGPIADAFLVAFRLPNLFRRLFAEGAFAAAFVPMFSGRLQQDGRKAALAFGEEVMAVLFAALLVFTALAEAFMPILVAILAPGFLDQPERFGPAVLFSRLTFPYLMCMALLAFFAGILNSFYRFAVPSAAPILLNVVLIAALAVSPRSGPARRGWRSLSASALRASGNWRSSSGTCAGRGSGCGCAGPGSRAASAGCCASWFRARSPPARSRSTC